MTPILEALESLDTAFEIKRLKDRVRFFMSKEFVKKNMRKSSAYIGFDAHRIYFFNKQTVKTPFKMSFSDTNSRMYSFTKNELFNFLEEDITWKMDDVKTDDEYQYMSWNPDKPFGKAPAHAAYQRRIKIRNTVAFRLNLDAGIFKLFNATRDRMFIGLKHKQITISKDLTNDTPYPIHMGGKMNSKYFTIPKKVADEFFLRDFDYANENVFWDEDKNQLILKR